MTASQPPLNWQLVDSHDALETLLDRIDSATLVTLDLETTGLREYQPHISPPRWVPPRIVVTSLTLEDSDGSPTTFVIPESHPAGWFAQNGMAEYPIHRLAQHLAQTRSLLIGQNIKFDVRWIAARTGIDLSAQMYWDTALAAKLLDENESASLKTAVPKIFGVEAWDDNIDFSKPGAAESIPIEQLAEYAARDTHWTFLWWRWQSWLMGVPTRRGEEISPPELPDDYENYRLGKVMLSVSMRAARTLARMEITGIRLDLDKTQTALKASTEEFNSCLAEISTRFPDEVETYGKASIAATSKFFKAIAERQVQSDAWTVLALTPGGVPQWNAFTLKENTKLNPRDPLAATILQARNAKKQSEFLDSWLQKVSVAGRIHANYNQLSVVTGRLSSSDPNMQQCLRGDVEVLTPVGWCRLDRLADDTPVMQSNEAGEFSFVVPSEVHRIPHFGGNGIQFKASWGEVWTTKDHRVLSYTRNGLAIWETADKWVEGSAIPDRKFLRAGWYSGGIEELKHLDYMAIAAQADGTSSGPCWEIKVYKERKRAALRRLGGIDRIHGGREHTYLRVRKDQISDWIDSEKNFIAEKILKLSQAGLREFLREVMLWDGDYTRGNTYKQRGDRRQSVDAVQIAAALTGHSSSIYVHVVDGKSYPTVNVHRKALRNASRMSVTETPGPDMVYCVTVPSGAFLIRSEGTTLVTGNCSKTLRPMFIPDPGYYIADFDYSQIELRVVAFLARCQPILDAFNRGDDLHRLFAAQLTGKPPERVAASERQRAKACIAAGELVSTPRGVVPIEALQPSDKVWDGVEWVSHDGVEFRGIRETVTQNGLTATPDHLIFLSDGSTVCWGYAKDIGHGATASTASSTSALSDHLGEYQPNSALREKGSPPRRNFLRSLLENLSRTYRQPARPEGPGLSMSAKFEVSRPPGVGFRGALRRYGAAVSDRNLEFQKLRRQRNPQPIPQPRTLHSLDIREPASQGLPGGADRPNRQPRKLRSGESATRQASSEFSQSASHPVCRIHGDASCPNTRLALAQDRQSRLPIQPVLDPEITTGGANSRPATPEDSQWSRQAVFDIVNAGPRHRFSVSGHLVHNCSFGLIYGMSAQSFQDYAYANYDLKLTDSETAQMRDRFFEFWAGLREWHEKCRSDARRNGQVVSPIGRVRRLPDIYSTNSYKASHAERSAINAPVQGFASDLLQIGASYIPRHIPLVATVHDSVVVLLKQDRLEEDLNLVKTALTLRVVEHLKLKFRLELPVPLVADCTIGSAWGLSDITQT